MLDWKSGDGVWENASGSHAFAGKFHLRVWWDTTAPIGSETKWRASFAAWRLKARFATEAEARQAVERLAEKTLRAALAAFIQKEN